MRRAKRVAGLQILQAHAGADVACQNLGYILALVGMHLQQPAHAIGLAGAGIEYRIAGLERAGVDADEAQLAEGIVDDLECQSRQRLIVVRLADFSFGGMRRIDALDGRLVQRAGQVIDHGIQKRLDAFVFKCASADDWENFQVDGGLANAGFQLIDGGRLAFEKLFQQHVVGLGDDFDQLQAEGLGLLLQVGGNRLDVVLRAHCLVLPYDGLHLDQVNNSPEVSFGADGNLQSHGPGAQALANGFQNVFEIRAVLVHLVDKTDARHFVLVALPPHRLGLRLHAAD